MSVHRPVITPELAEQIEQRRGMVPFQTFVNELLRIGLAAQREVADAVADAAEQNARSVPSPVPKTLAKPKGAVPLSESWRR